MSEIVVSGFSGKFPECENVDEFEKKLYGGVDMVTEDDRRWPVGIHGLPGRNGKLKDLSRFDAAFFGVSPKQADAMDPQTRLLIENTYEAIMDAGYNPEELRGRKIGVFVGQTGNESLDLLGRDPETLAGYNMSGGNRAMTSNRISFTFDFRGLSYTVDTACSSSLVCLHEAVEAIRRGEIEAAIVGGVNVLLSPMTSLMYFRLNMLSEDGTCRAFDASGKGYVRSETTGVIFLQRAESARRAYATVIGTGANVDGHKEMGITYPMGERQQTLIREVLQKAKISPKDVSYAEAHGTGTKAGDPQEINSLHGLLCVGAGRTEPLLLGSVKSNIGHAESAAAIGQLAKVILAMERGEIPANLHYDKPNAELVGLLEGSMKVVDKNLPWSGGIATINSFGFGGANANVILKSHQKTKKMSKEKSTIPMLVTSSGRSEEAVEHILRKAEEYQDDQEFLCLLREIFKLNSPGHSHRGFLLAGDKTPTVVDSFQRRKVWFVFSGIGSQWVGMGRQLLVFKPFSKTLNKCAGALKTVGIDLFGILNNEDEAQLDVMSSFISIVSIQVGLVDLLKAVGVTPDGMVGHSAGELSCAYADGGFTAEEAALAAYSRGFAINTCNVKGGAMAAVGGLEWEEVKRRVPKNVHAACHNAIGSVTVSGPEADVMAFVKSLEADGVKARTVNSSGVAFHSPYIAPAGPTLVQSLKKIQPHPKPRTSRWVSSCVPSHLADEPWTSINSAEYHAYNLTHPVLFKEAVDKIPEGSLIVEVAPHALLSGLVKKSVPNSEVVGLANKDVPDGVTFLLRSLGKIYNCGVAVDLRGLYPAVEYPVSRGTPKISSLIKWDHSTEWQVPLLTKTIGGSGGFEQIIDLKKEDQSYLSGHCIDGRILFPATGYLTLAWKAFAKLEGKQHDEVAVIITDVHIHRATVLSLEGSVKLTVNVFGGSGKFEIAEGESQVVTGAICKAEDAVDGRRASDLPPPLMPQNSQKVPSEDVYKELRLRHYEYSGAFRGIKNAHLSGRSGSLDWANNWVTFMDTMLQFDIVGNDTRELYLPVRIDQVIIDPHKHKKAVGDDNEIPVFAFKELSIIKSGGVEMRNLKVNHARKRPIGQSPPKLERHVFLPYKNCILPTVEDAITAALQIVLENSEGSVKIKTLEIAEEATTIWSHFVADSLAEEPNIMADLSVVAAGSGIVSFQPEKQIRLLEQSLEEALKNINVDLVIASNVSRNPKLFDSLSSSLKIGNFILSAEDELKQDSPSLSNDVVLVADFVLPNKTLLLFRKVLPNEDVTTILLDEESFLWTEAVNSWLKRFGDSGKKLLLVSQGVPTSGIVGFLKCLRLEEHGKAVRCMLIPNGEVSLEDPSVVDQIKKGLTVNVFRGSQWGSLRHLKISTDTSSTETSTDHAYVNALVRGDLSSLRWIHSPLSLPPSEGHGVDKEYCTVYYAPLNFRDIMLATGKLPPDALPGNLTGQDCVLGLEFAGRDSRGKRVIGIVEAKGLATTVLADSGFLWDVPDAWSLEDASTVPIVYSTAYYALIVRGKLRRGETVLIHAGSGGVGLAAISIALNLGCRVFTTVGSQSKRNFLLRVFGQLRDSDIGNSRDTSFEWMVLNGTSGRGADLVLNSLAGEQLKASVRCLAEGGRFLEIGKVDLSNNSSLGMSVFLKNTTFHGILLDALFQVGVENPEKAEVVRLMREGIKSGVVIPLPVTVFQSDQLEEAFRYMATGKHIGKVVLKIRQEEPEKVVDPRKEFMSAVSRNYMDPAKSYILVGGLGGFGLELADWLVSRGATRLVLSSRSGVTTGYQELCLRRWRSKSVKIVVSTADCTNGQGAEDLIASANRLGPVGGIYNLAGVLRDGNFAGQTAENFATVSAGKADVTRYLDAVSQTACPSLEHFVVFSSVSCGRGNAGQTNYGWANSVMERICEKRREKGLPALAIQWGAVGDVGMVMNDLKGDNETRVAGTLPQRIISCLAALDTFLGISARSEATVVSSIVLATKGGQGVSSTAAVSIASIVANIVGIKDAKKAGDSTLAELGMDSLMGTEIKQALEINLDLVLTPNEIRALTFAKLDEFDKNRDRKTD